MAKLFDGAFGNRVVPIWHAAATHLLTCPERSDMNLVLEISNPLSITAADKQLMLKVDEALKNSTECNLTLDTVASTIFPYRMYKRHGRPGMYAKYFNSLDRGKKPNTWGTYAERMMSHQAKDGLNLSDPEVDLAPIMDIFGDGGDLPTYKAAFDARATRNRPCLSHVSFKLVDTNRVNLTALYRSHHYCARALGNLIGLAGLLKFVAEEAELEVGTLTCISTFATVDHKTWGGLAATKKLLATYKTD